MTNNYGCSTSVCEGCLSDTCTTETKTKKAGTFGKTIVNKTALRQRMYCIVLRQLNQIQKGIQSAHAVVEYISRFGNDKEVERWMVEDKTLILLDGGTCPDMRETVEAFNENGVWYSFFQEEDLDGMTTAISVLANEMVWDRDTYPDYSGPVSGWDDSSMNEYYEKMNNETLKGYGMTDTEIFLRGCLSKMRLAN